MTQLKNYLLEQGALNTVVRVIFPGVDFDTDEGEGVYQDVAEYLEDNESVLKYSRVPNTANMLDISTNLNVEENVVTFSDAVLYNIRYDLLYEVRILFVQ